MEAREVEGMEVSATAGFIDSKRVITTERVGLRGFVSENI
jgi:hypothetical protein